MINPQAMNLLFNTEEAVQRWGKAMNTEERIGVCIPCSNRAPPGHLPRRVFTSEDGKRWTCTDCGWTHE